MSEVPLYLTSPLTKALPRRTACPMLFTPVSRMVKSPWRYTSELYLLGDFTILETGLNSSLVETGLNSSRASDIIRTSRPW
jgi:hypothetical protein